MKLSDVCTKETSNIAQKDLDSCNGCYPIYGASGFIKNVDFYHQEKPYIAIVKDGAGVGRVMLLPAKSSVIGTMQYIIPKEGVSVEYLAYALEHMNLSKYYLGAAIPHIYFKDYCKESMPKHTEEEQINISRTLGLVCNLISLCTQQLSKLDELVKSRFIELFGDLKTNPHNWQCRSLLDVAEIDTTMVTDYEKYADYPHIGIDSIEKNTGRLFGYRTIAEDRVISGKYLFTAKHIIYSKIRPNLNKVALPDFEGLCSADAYPILPKENVCLRIYLGYVMRSEFFLDYILPFSRRANMPKVNKEQLSGFVLPVPPIDLQNRFAAFVEQTDKSKLAIQQSLDKLEILKKAMMQKYFDEVKI